MLLSYGFLKKLTNMIVQTFIPYRLVGKDKVPDGACVLVGNHYRGWDIVHMAHTTKEKMHFITKKEVWDHKFMAYLCKVVEAIPVSRDGHDAKAVMSAFRCLKNGEKITIFPEGTRNKTKDQELLPLKSGATMFAIKAQVPIYPVMSLRKTRPFIPTKIIVGDPIDFSDFYGKRLTEEDYAVADERLRERMLATKHDYLEQQAAKKAAKKNRKKGKEQK